MESGSKLLDPTPFLREAFDKYGRVGAEMAMERIEVMDQGMRLSPHSGMRYTEWSNVETP